MQSKDKTLTTVNDMFDKLFTNPTCIY